MAEVVKVLIVDDDSPMRAGLRTIVGEMPGVVLAGEANGFEEALRLCQQLGPDVLLLPLDLSQDTAIEMVSSFRDQCPGTNVLIVGQAADETLIKNLMRAGAAGFIPKNQAREVLFHAIPGVARGVYWFTRSVLEKGMSGLPVLDEQVRRTDISLTKREAEVLRLLVKGWTNARIASTLGLSEKTVEMHIRGVFAKMRVMSRVEAAVQAVRSGLV